MTASDRRSVARFAALQALYQLEMTGADAGDVIDEFLHHRLTKDEADEEFFAEIVHGVIKSQAAIDQALAGSLSAGWTLGRIDSILRALLRAAAYELIERADVPAKVVINEYVELARDFFVQDEPGFVNAVLDRLARENRPTELSGGSAL